ncbi:uncharacterized protein LOC113506770 isoform X1 [Trichoplusia ni]|uniref:Uncharacterized protein LOC113505108 isoform X1 n=1 Tax=Trichoplusia ni TaxID=7111 RepID=A0A7E5WRN1_TRINI|nr:uncharacterized protein LOC113505108 isoform X1 [Trichoplusia ni]XP_026745402.1 uncharacterized protein LOC113506770 isoform X1 [Trichoplusia ni]
MSSSALDNEDLENVHLVRMEDVQPSRDRIERVIDVHGSETDEEEVYETCIIDEIDYERDCVGEDSDSNIGSMVSIQSEDILDDASDNEELIVPEVSDPAVGVEIPIEIEPISEIKQKPPDSWPTLEILPGGVIKNANETDVQPKVETESKKAGEMMYACAKCSQTFKYLFCLVKHVKWHEEQQKIMQLENTGELTPMEQELVLIKKARSEFDKKYKKQKVEILARIASAIGRMDNVKDILNKKLH